MRRPLQLLDDKKAQGSPPPGCRRRGLGGVQGALRNVTSTIVSGGFFQKSRLGVSEIKEISLTVLGGGSVWLMPNCKDNNSWQNYSILSWSCTHEGIAIHVKSSTATSTTRILEDEEIVQVLQQTLFVNTRCLLMDAARSLCLRLSIYAFVHFLLICWKGGSGIFTPHAAMNKFNLPPTDWAISSAFEHNRRSACKTTNVSHISMELQGLFSKKKPQRHTRWYKI